MDAQSQNCLVGFQHLSELMNWPMLVYSLELVQYFAYHLIDLKLENPTFIFQIWLVDSEKPQQSKDHWAQVDGKSISFLPYYMLMTWCEIACSNFWVSIDFILWVFMLVSFFEK
jgi:hypothetical protein